MKAYRAYDVLISAARPHSGLLRLFSGLVLLFAGVLALDQGFAAFLENLDLGHLNEERMIGTTRVGAILALFSFLIPAMVLWVVLRGLHNRALSGVLGPKVQAQRDFFKVMIAMLCLMAISIAIPTPEAMRPEPKLALASWVIWAPLGVIGILLQVSTEEFIFRGYLQSQLAARFQHPAIWLIVPSAIFGLLHYAPMIYGDNAIYIAAWAFLFGIIAADLTARAGNLGPAIALHFVNNVVAIMIVAMEGHLSGIALFVLPYGADDTMLLRQTLWVELLALICMWLAARLVLRR